MATQQQRDRRDSAKVLVERRIEFWSSKIGEDQVLVDGRTCNPDQKLKQAEYELAQLKAKP